MVGYHYEQPLALTFMCICVCVSVYVQEKERKENIIEGGKEFKCLDLDLYCQQ